jgi:HSP90 family molecular chaperone
MDFPDIQTTKTTANLLNHFQTLCFSDPDNMNYQTIYEDINFLLKKAVEQQDDFKEDMKDLLGDDVLACTKVGQVNKEGRTSFNACAVRRVFVKWC